MANFVYNFLQDSTGSCIGCTGGCSGVSPDPSGSGCFTCSGSGACVTYTYICSGVIVPSGQDCSNPNRSRSNSTCTGAMCWEEGDVYQENEYAYYDCKVWESFTTDNEERPGDGSSWDVVTEDCCSTVPSGGSGRFPLPCMVMVSGASGNCQVKYKLQVTEDMDTSPYYEACDIRNDLSYGALFISSSGYWETFGPQCEPLGPAFVKSSTPVSCGPTGTYFARNVSAPANMIKVRVCDWCAGCGCPESGVFSPLDCGCDDMAPATWWSRSGCPHGPVSPPPQ